MLTMSSRWLPAMQAGALEIVTIGEIWSPPTPMEPLGALSATFNVVSGELVTDVANAIRRTAQDLVLIPFPEDPLGLAVPNYSTDLLYPDSGAEIIIRKGCLYPDGTTEVAQLGRLLMEDVDIYNASSSDNVYIELNGRDRGGTIDRAGFTSPYATDGRSKLDVQLTDLINFAVPNLPLNITPSNLAPAQMTFSIGSSPWTAALALAAAGGYELFADVYGTITARPVVDPTTLPVSVFYDSSPETESGITTAIQRSVNTTGIPNVIIMAAQGSNIPHPFISYWWDSDPDSFTFYNIETPTPGVNMYYLPTKQGSYPLTTASKTNAAATTQEQNDSIASGIGLAAKGSFDVITMSIRDNPAHDVEDVIGVYDPESTVTQKRYWITTITEQMDHKTAMEIQGQYVGELV